MPNRRLDSSSIPPIHGPKKELNLPRYAITIKHPSLSFSSAHFLVDHEKCGHLHGHNYGVSALIAGPLQKQAMVIDFIQVKNLIRKECSLLDHKILIPRQSPFFEIN